MRPTAPRVSVIIPAYYSYGTVTRSLTAIRAQTLRDFEIIGVVKDVKYINLRETRNFSTV